MGVVLHRLDKQRQSEQLAEMMRCDNESHHHFCPNFFSPCIVVFIIVVIFIVIIVTSILIIQGDNVNSISKQFGISRIITL